MTLEEAIIHCEEVASDRAGCCEDCANEHRQLAEWLKDYKRLRELELQPCEQQPCTDAISRAEAIRVASGYCHYTNIPAELAKLPSVTQTPKNVNDVLDAIKADLQTLADDEWNQQVMASKGLEFAIEIIENYQMAMMEGVEE